MAALAACEKRVVTTVDIGGAYLNASMEESGVIVHMRLDKIMTEILVKIDPKFKKFVAVDGSSVVQLDKALYGCVEAAYTTSMVSDAAREVGSVRVRGEPRRTMCLQQAERRRGIDITDTARR